MEGQRLIFVNLLILLFGFSSPDRCDRATTARVQEGNIGQSGDFNWLGVLSVHLHDDDKFRMAMTGIVLIKMRYAIANADDIVRIPQAMFKSDSKAMFLAAKNNPWFVKPSSYVTHPEYEYSTLNSIALIEFNLDEVNDYPLNPICIPSGEKYNTSRYLYLTGFTDENQAMEKVIYKIQYLDKKVCEEFYHRAGLSSQKRIPSAYLCGYAPSNVTQCVWDNGMVLVSNASGYFNLIGFGVHGPGCAAPARFIDLFQYFYWINSVTSPDEIYDDSSFSRRDDNEFIPVHELFTMNGSHRKAGEIVTHQFQRYPFDKDAMKHHIIRPDEDEKSILIYRFYDKWEQFTDACSSPKDLMYSELFTLTSRPRSTKGSITYKLSLYDLHNTVACCVRLTVDSISRSQAILSFKEVINFKKGTGQIETPEEILQVFTGAKFIRKPKPEIQKETENQEDPENQEEPGSQKNPGNQKDPESQKNPESQKYSESQKDSESQKNPEGQEEPGSWFPDPDRLRPKFITDDDVFYGRVLNCDLYVKVEFFYQATLNFEIYAEPGGLSPNRSWWDYTTTTESATTAPREKPILRLRTTTPKTVFWGVDVSADNMVREDEVKVVTHVEEVEETESAASIKRAPGPVVLAWWLISAFLLSEESVLLN